MAEYYHNLITEKSWGLLHELRTKFELMLIGGWAVYLYTRAMKSKDIDLIIDYDALETVRRSYECQKNERLRKYEIKVEAIDIDLYLPHFSNVGLPAEVVQQHTASREGFVVPTPEILLMLKQYAYHERRGTPKGEKDKIDIISLLGHTVVDWKRYLALTGAYRLPDFPNRLRTLLQSTAQVPELQLGDHATSRLKKRILAQLEQS